MRELRMLVVAVVVTLALPAAAQAATFAVDRLDEAHDASTANNVCDAVGGGCTLRAAVEQANVTAGADQINLPTGTIVLDDDGSGALDVVESLTVVGTGIDTSIIDGSGLLDATFVAAGTTGSLLLQDLALTGDTSDSSVDAVVDSSAPDTTLRRAAIFDSTGPTILGAWPEDDGTLTLDGARLYGNQAPFGIVDAAPDGNGTVTITDTVINGNQVTSSQGVPSIVAIDPSGNSDVAIARSTFSKNSITGTARSQGVVDINPYMDGDDVTTTLRIADSAFLANLLGNAGRGALQIRPTADSASGPVDAEITRTRFEDNVGGTGGSGTGGAIDFRPGDDLATATRSLAITDSSFLRNVAGAGGAGQGGAINWSPDSGPSHLTIDGSTFAGNRAGADDSESYSYGGAINFARGALTVRNSTFSANRAEFGDDFHSGGAISLGSVTDAQLTHVTMVGNSVGQGPGGGISVQPYFTSTAAGAAVVSPVPSGDLTVTNSIVAGNTSDAPNGPIVASGVRAQAAPVPADCSRPVTSGGGNIEGDTTCGFTGTGDHQTTDPKVAPLAANGGLTTTHAIGKDSPAFDAALGSACLPKDQRGVTRPQFAACDIGAFELAAPPPPTPAPVPAGAVQGQTQRSCVSRRAFRIRIRVPKGAKVVRAMVLVNGKPVAVRRGTRLTAPVRLRGLPKGRFRVKIVLFLKDGRRISGTRRYHTCHEAIPPKRVPKV